MSSIAKRLFIVVIALMICLFSFVSYSWALNSSEQSNNDITTQAEPSWKTIGTCEWDINGGVLTIRPINNAEYGELPSCDSWPWNDYFAKYRSLEIQGHVIAGSNLSNFIKVDDSNGGSRFTVDTWENLDTSQTRSMAQMFKDSPGIISLSLTGLDTSNVEDFSGMFSGCTALSSLDISDLDTSNAVDMSSMFNKCSSLKSVNVSHFDTSKTRNMYGMFSGCSGLTSIDVRGFDTSSVTDFGLMFCKCSNITSLDLSHFNTANAETMQGMFFDCITLKTVSLENFDTHKVTDMRNMFGNCRVLSSLDVSMFDTSNVKSMCEMFVNCTRLSSLDVTGFDTSSLVNMSYIFAGCSSLNELNLSSFDTKNVTNMDAAFEDCSNITLLDLSGFDTSNTTRMQALFSGCTRLASLDLSSFDTTGVTVVSGMFMSCGSLSKIKVSATFTYLNLLPSPDRTWYNTKREAFTPKTIPVGVADTYATSISLLPPPTVSISSLSIEVEDQVFNGSPVKPVIVVKNGSTVLSEDIDYSLDFANNTNAGDASVIIYGIGSYSGSMTKSFKINPAPIDEISIAIIDDQEYAEAEVMPSVVAQLGSYSLVQGVDYSLSYSNNSNPGTGTVTIKGLGNFVGSRDVSFSIFGNANSFDVADVSDQIYNGAAHKPSVNVALNGEKLVEGHDYSVSYENNIDAGTATIFVEGIGNYSGTIKKFFIIQSASISQATLDGIGDQIFTGSNIELPIKVHLGNRELSSDDYVVTYENNKNVGTATVKVEGRGNYKDSVSKSFQILPSEGGDSSSGTTGGDDSSTNPGNDSSTSGSSGSSTDTPNGDSSANTPNGGSSNSNVPGSEGNKPNDTDEGISAPAVSGSWVKSHGKWWFKYDAQTKAEQNNKTYPANEWVSIKGKVYHFDSAGWMHAGWQKLDSKWYYFGSDGAMKTGWQKVKGTWYFMAPSGIMKTGWLQDNGSWYYLKSSGAMSKGWEKIDNTWYYFANSGAMKTGWVKVKGKWYYLAVDGKMQTGWQKVDGKWYYLKDSGAMKTGWFKDGSKWYYLNKSGAMATDKWISGKYWYWVGSNGVMATNSWVDQDRYYVDSEGRWIKGKTR